jgi:Prolyl oligopeptidase family
MKRFRSISPWECPEVYVASSPIAAADRIRTPLLLIHADLDRNCPIAQSEQMLAALRSLGRDIEFVVIRGEGHLMNLTGRPSRRLARARAVDRWLGRYLGLGVPVTTTSPEPARRLPPTVLATCVLPWMTGCASTRTPPASTSAWSPCT